MNNTNSMASRGTKGGLARATILSKNRRIEIAKKAAETKWMKKREESQKKDIMQVLEGFKNVLRIADVSIPCAIVQGPNGIKRVLSEFGVTKAILGTGSGASKKIKKASIEQGAPLPIFVAPSQLKPFINDELLDGPLKPIDYLDGDKLVRGYDASILATVCNIWLKAREAGVLQVQQLPKAQKAEILARSLAETGIVALVDEATGYQNVRPQNALQAYLELVIRRELAIWAKKFPDEFYENIYKLKGWSWPGMKKNRYSVVAKYTTDLIYERVGPGVLDELIQKTPKNEKGVRPNKLHQWLTEDIGDPMLARHIHTVIMFQKLAIANGYGWRRFLQIVDQVLPKKGKTLELPLEQVWTEQ